MQGPFGDAGALVLDADPDRRLRPAVAADEAVLEGHARRDEDPARFFFHRLHRVSHEIEEDLLQPRFVGLEFRQRRIVAADDLDAFVAAFELDQVEERIEELVDVHALVLEPVAPGEHHELVDQPRDAVDLADDQARRPAAAVVLRAHPDQLGGAADAPERVADLVGDAGGDVAVGFLALPLADLLAQGSRSAAVAHGDRDGGGATPRRVADVGDRHVDGDRILEALRNLDLVVDRSSTRAPHPLDHPADGMIRAEHLT